MAPVQTRRSAPVLPALILGAGALLLHQSRSFVTVASANRGNVRGRTAMRGFKEDFDAWKSTLSDEEKTMIQTQAEGEFNKKFRKSDEFKKDLPQEKLEAFSKVLEKFFDAEAADYKKEADTRGPDPDALKKRAKQGGGLEFSLKSSIVEIDRDADRRYQFASMKIKEAQDKGEYWPQSSPLEEIHQFKNDDEDSHKFNLQVLETMKKIKDLPDVSAEVKGYVDEFVKKGVPPMGEKFDITLPQVMFQQWVWLHTWIEEGFVKWSEGKSDDAKDKVKAELNDVFMKTAAKLAATYKSARDEIEEAVVKQKKWFKSQKKMPGKTKADVMKEMWAELPKYAKNPVPPLDDEMLAELAVEPATSEDEYMHPWGIADKLYKSEAIDHFGTKYLLGIFENKEDAAKAFESWNAEYLAAKKTVQEEMVQWNKREQAKLDSDVQGQARIKEMLSGR